MLNIKKHISVKYVISICLALALLCGIHMVSPIIEVKTAVAAGDFTKAPDPAKGKGPYADGTYEGSSEGYNGELKMQVTVQEGWITALAILETGDDKEYLDKAKAPVLQKVLDEQTTAVDAVAGATFSSYGMLDAIDDALANA